MLNQADAKQNSHSNRADDIFYKFPGENQSYSGACLSLSGSSILFRAQHFIESGRALEITINKKSALTASMIAYVEVLRTNEVAGGMFEVATEIKGIKEN